MQFLYPQFLYALGFLAVPLIIHFFTFRRYKRQEFTNVAFLEKASQKNRRVQQLKNWLVLLFRMLAITALVLAFAQPVSKEELNGGSGQPFVSFYLDNSFSMGLEGSDGELFEIARKRIETITDGFGENAQFQLLTNSRQLFSKGFDGQEDFLSQLEQTEISHQRMPYNAVYDQQRSNLSEVNGSRHLIWLSDFQLNQGELKKLDPDTGLSMNWIPMRAEKVTNVAIDSAWLEQAMFERGGNAEVFVRIKNYSNEAISNRSLKLEANGIQKAVQVINLAPAEAKVLKLSFRVEQGGWHRLTVRIEDFPINFDNTFYNSLYVKEEIPVLCLQGKEGNDAIARVYATSDNYRYVEKPEGTVDYGVFPNYDLIILNGLSTISSGFSARIIEYIKAGGNVLFFPSQEMQATDRELLASFTISAGQLQDGEQMGKIEAASGFFNNVFSEIPRNTVFPQAYNYYSYQISSLSKAVTLMQFNNGLPFLSMSPKGQGYFIACASPLSKESTNLAQHALFVPIMYKAALFRGQEDAATYFLDKKPIQLSLPTSLKGDALAVHYNASSFIPEQNYVGDQALIFKGEQFSKAGFYELQPRETSDTLLNVFGLNYQREESQLEFYQEEELKEEAERLGAILNSGDNNSLSSGLDKARLWRWFLIAALFFILLEVLAIKFVRK